MDEAPRQGGALIRFSGHESKVRTASAVRGGLNHLYDADNVWTDASGAMHLRVAKKNKGWTCARVILARSLGYGTYRFVVRDTSHLEPAVVMSVHTFDEWGGDQHCREMDVEIGHWGDGQSTENAQYGVQPFYVPGNVAQFREPPGTVTHTMVWVPERATFRTVRGVSPNGDAPVVSQRVFTSGIPTPGREFLEFMLCIVTSDKNPLEKGTEGFDPGWSEPIATRQVAYTNPDSGKYRFRMMASNSDGLWNSEELSLPIEAEPVFWKRWWFRASSVVVVVLALMTYLRLRVQRMAKQMDMRFEERLAERTRIARELHDSLLQGFQGLMFRLQAVRDMLPERPNEAAQALESTLDRGDEIIAEGRSTLEDLRDSSLREGDIVQALTNVGEELAHIGNGKAVGMRVLVEGKPREFDPMLRDEIYQIGREAMRNAFQHAQAQKIETELTYGDSEFSLRVRDDGNGIDPEVFQEGRREGHWGLPGMRERAKRLGGQLHVWTESGAGTEIELTVPGSVVYVGTGSRSKFWFLKRNLRGPYGRRS
jgi:signal transduction histidine kinase